MKKVLIDTSILIEFLRLKRKKTVYEQILAKRYRPVISFITGAELWAGKSVWEKKDKTILLKNLLAGIEVVFPSSSTLKLSGKLRVQYQISLLDAFIAACAIEKKLPLSTLNVRDFKKIQAVKIFEFPN